MPPACSGKGNRDLRSVEWTTRQNCCLLQFIHTFDVSAYLNVVLTRRAEGVQPRSSGLAQQTLDSVRLRRNSCEPGSSAVPPKC